LEYRLEYRLENGVGYVTQATTHCDETHKAEKGSGFHRSLAMELGLGQQWTPIGWRNIAISLIDPLGTLYRAADPFSGGACG
jgi:hypothetical protein